MRWYRTWRDDPDVRVLADRHYSRQNPGASGFTPPGRTLILRTPEADAGWATSWPYSEHSRHTLRGAYVCSFFRNESPHLSSELVLEAVAATVDHFVLIPDEGFLTYVDVEAVRRKRDPGRCFRKAGFRPIGYTKTRGRLILHLPADAFPAPAQALPLASPLFDPALYS